MKKFLKWVGAGVVILSLSCVAASKAKPPRAPIPDEIIKARREVLTIGTLKVENIKGLVTDSTAITITPAVAASGGVTAPITGDVIGNLTGNVTGYTIDTGTALNVTNGQPVSLTGGVILINGIGGADDSTNTITVSGTVGTETRLIVAAASTNLITIADSGTVYLSGAWLGDNNDVIDLYVRTATTNVVEVGSVDN